MRPESIRQFEYFYLGSILVALVNLVMTHTRISSAFYSLGGDYVPGAGSIFAGFFTASLGFGLLFGLLIPLALWYFAARKASQTARWIAVVLGVLSAIHLLFLVFLLGWLIVSKFPIEGWFWWSMMLGIISETLHMGALYFLFPADAREWFARGHMAVRHQDIFS